MKKVLLIFFALVGVLPLRAQTDFRPGYVVTNENDTLQGLIDYREGTIKYDTCFFKRSPEAGVVKFTAGAIRSYRFLRDKFFASKTIKSHTDTLKNVFAEVIVRGKVSLFRIRKDFYVSKDTSALYKLVNEKQVIRVGGKRVMVESNRYIGVLNFLMSDCDRVRADVRNARLYERSLTELAERYNHCLDQRPVTYKSDLSFMDISVGLSAGGSLTDLGFRNGLSPDGPFAGEFRSSVSLLGGAFVDLSSPRVNPRLAFHVGVLYSHSMYYSFHSYRQLYYTDRHYVTLDVKRLQVPFGIRYALPERKYTPYLNAGLICTYNISGDSRWIREREIDNVVETYKSNDVGLGKSQAGIWAGFGIRRQVFPSADILLEVRYVNMPGSFRTAEPFSSAGPSVSGLQILLGIRTK
ncbi:MAG: outer membrane beta-barrel protein [Bacteroidota bacterium]|nr:outer membrane beta-barrel protein [Bacteroidota bacterium]